ncbi:MAG TPA: RNA polymerase sigma factor [Polyangiaceae bacterium]|nr:RNA polymerase sigma factor [Polyangiaceae bacterium]
MVLNPVPKSAPNIRLVPKDGDVGRAPQRRPPAPPSLDDAELLAALRRGDATAAAAFHDRVRPQVDRTIFRLLGRRDNDREDVAQQALIQLIYTIDGYRGACSLDTWTSTLTAHVVYKHLRRRQTERRLFAEMLEPDAFVSSSTRRTGRDAMGRSAVKRVAEHLDQLESNQAWTFMLHDVMGYDLREVAKITGVSVAAAQTRLVRGRRALHERIGQDGDLADTLEEMERAE